MTLTSFHEPPEKPNRETALAAEAEQGKKEWTVQQNIKSQNQRGSEN